MNLGFCVSACKHNRLRSGNANVAFISRGFQNWKDATIAFRTHESSSCHKEAVEQMITLPVTTRHVGECLSSAVAEEKRINRACFMKLLTSVQFLARQGLALRGDGKGEVDGNFNQLLKLRSKDESDGMLTEWMKKKSSKYTRHDIQNEMLHIMAMRILRSLLVNIQSSKFTIMIDETTDVATHEQVVVVFRWVESHEDFVGMYVTDLITSNALVAGYSTQC
jgi:hypothetical protein